MDGNIDTVREALEGSRFVIDKLTMGTHPALKEMDGAISALSAIEADRDAWKAKAERYREALEIMSRDESLRWVGFVARDFARAALQEDTL